MPFLAPLRLRANLKAKLKFGLFLYQGCAPGEARPDSHGEISELAVADAEVVTAHWDHSDERSYIEARIEGGPSACIRSEAGDPMAWGLTHSEGAIGVVFTLESARRQGFGEKVVRALTTRLLAKGQVPFCYIAEKNEASAHLFEKCGYVRQPQPVFWALCQGAAPPESESDSD